jgi:hypothetical protein
MKPCGFKLQGFNSVEGVFTVDTLKISDIKNCFESCPVLKQE